MQVTLDMFSGRPNPTWRLTPREGRELVERVAAHTVAHADQPRGALGFRGFRVLADTLEETAPAGLPPAFTIAQPTVLAADPVAQDAETGAWLCGTAKQAVADDVLDLVSRSLASERVEISAAPMASRGEALEPRAAEEATALADLLAEPACLPYLSPMRLAFWNSPAIQPGNNCYNYAVNQVTGTLAQPGRRANQVYTDFTCEALREAALADGLLEGCEGSARVVALAVWPGTDFHWWRLHPFGFWAHKVGGWPATDRDNRGRLIGHGLDPETCDRGPYSLFCGYYLAPLGMWVL